MTDLATKEDRIADRINTDLAQGMAMQPIDGGGAFVPTSVGQMMEVAKMMATAKIAVRQHFRGNPGSCLAVCMQAARWGMDPFSVANKAFVVNDQLAYEAQLIVAVLNTRAPIKGRIKYEFSGKGNSRTCRAWAYLLDEEETIEATSPELGGITPKNSPLWKSDPDQQLCYYTARVLARRHFPEVLMGVYDVDEMRQVGNGRMDASGAVVDINPSARPSRSDYTDQEREEPEQDPLVLIDAYGQKVGTFMQVAGYLDMFVQQIENCPLEKALESLMEHNEEAMQALSKADRDSLMGLVDAARDKLRRDEEAIQEPECSPEEGHVPETEDDPLHRDGEPSDE